MRILTVTHYQPPHAGGVETVAGALVERYRKAGHEAVWLASDIPPISAPPNHVRVPSWNVLEDTLGVPYPLWHPRGIAVARRWVEWCDTVHCHDCLYLGTVLALRSARRLAKPVLLTQHVGPVPYRSAVVRAVQQLAYATIGRAVHRRVDQVVFISHTVRAWFEQQVVYGRPPQFVANGVDTSLFYYADEAERQAARQRLHLPLGERLILFVGRFVDKKGIPIVEQVASRHADWQFVVVGEGPIDPCTWRLQNVVVRHFQPQAALREYYWAADMLLLPSTGEGFPLAVMEAMACGTPALISSETFAAWNNGREYFLVSEPNSAAVTSLLDQEPTLLRAEARAQVAAYARAYWNWEQVAKTYLRLLADLCRSASRTKGCA